MLNPEPSDLPPVHVIKLGGSLLDLPDLADRFARFVGAQPDARRAVVVGGGGAADLVRAHDRTFGLDESAGHWLAVRAMQLNAHLVASVLERCVVVARPSRCRDAWKDGHISLVDPVAWLERDERKEKPVPHRWSFTSDSISAHVARRLGAARLTLLKSARLEPGEGPVDLERAATLNIVDADFPAVADAIPSIDLVNLRDDPGVVVRLQASS